MWPFNRKKRAVTPLEKRAEGREYVYKYARGQFNEYQLVWVLSQYNYTPEILLEPWDNSPYPEDAGTFDDIVGWALEKKLITDKTYDTITNVRAALEKWGFFNG